MEEVAREPEVIPEKQPEPEPEKDDPAGARAQPSASMPPSARTMTNLAREHRTIT